MPNQLYIPTENALQQPSDLARALTNNVLGAYKHLKLPIAFGTADATVLFTVPTLPNGCVGLYLAKFWWEVTTSFTGGSASAIGLSSSNAGYSTAGDLLGGATGDVAATLVSTTKYKVGTAGAKISAASPGLVILVAADTIKFNRITSAFTAGAGFVHIDVAFID
jgi:hypothetical protein